jgi:Ni,Fe-hydrogenase maturation factor
MSFSSHRVEPDSLLALAQDMFGSRAEGYVLGVRGYEFDDYGESLSPGARQNLEAAVDFLEALLCRRNFAEVASRMPGESLN